MAEFRYTITGTYRIEDGYLKQEYGTDDPDEWARIEAENLDRTFWANMGELTVKPVKKRGRPRKEEDVPA